MEREHFTTGQLDTGGKEKRQQPPHSKHSYHLVLLLRFHEEDDKVHSIKVCSTGIWKTCPFFWILYRKCVKFSVVFCPQLPTPLSLHKEKEYSEEERGLVAKSKSRSFPDRTCLWFLQYLCSSSPATLPKQRGHIFLLHTDTAQSYSPFNGLAGYIKRGCSRSSKLFMQQNPRQTMS